MLQQDVGNHRVYMHACMYVYIYIHTYVYGTCPDSAAQENVLDSGSRVFPGGPSAVT